MKQKKQNAVNKNKTKQKPQIPFPWNDSHVPNQKFSLKHPPKKNIEVQEIQNPKEHTRPDPLNKK